MSRNLIKVAMRRAFGTGLPPNEEIEVFGADGEEKVYAALCKQFDCVKRNVIVPHKELFLEKDLLAVVRGVPFVIEIKNWKGEIGSRGDTFYQNKDNGVHKTLKSPVGTTNQFLSCMKKFYGIDQPVWGVVVFAEPDCRLTLPEEMDGIALLPFDRLIPFLKKRAAEMTGKFPPFDPSRLLYCTRIYSGDREFCKGILADNDLECVAEDGARVLLDTARLRYITVEHQPLRLRDKLYVTYANGESGVFYNRDAVLTLGCLDGSFRRFSLSRIRHVVF